MIQDFKWLWHNREKPTKLSRFFVVWAKRALQLPALLVLLYKPCRLRLRGAVIGRMVCLGESRIEGSLCNLSINNESSLGRCRIALHERVVIGRRVVINDDVSVLSGSHSLSDPYWCHVNKPIVIDDYAWIATGAIILPGVRIGRGAVVGAGAVVRSDVPDYTVVVGDPAVSSRTRRSRVLLYSPVLMNAPYEAWVGREKNCGPDG